MLGQNIGRVGLPDMSAGGRPSLKLDFVSIPVLNEKITFTRASTATFFNSSGVLTSAAINAPRFDYNPSTLAARGLLIEEARTNLLLQSADFTTTWTQTNVTITANTTASPDGGTNGETLLINSAGATTSQTSQSFTAGSTITVSVFAKKNASNFVRFEVGGLVNCWFDLNTGVTGTNGAGSGNVLFSAKSIQSISNGWYRCVLTVTTTTITTLGVNIFATNADNTSSSINSSIFLWGAQLEAGAFPTSYIPTTTTALTRNADVAAVNTLSPWFNAAASTVYFEGTVATVSDSQNPYFWSISDNTKAFGAREQIAYTRNASSAQTVGLVAAGGATNASVASSNTAVTANTVFKAAASYAANDVKVCVNGLTPATTASATLPTGLNTLKFGAPGWSAAPVANAFYVRRLTVYPRSFSGAELQTITA